MSDPTLQSRLDDALVDAQLLRDELRIARAMVEDAEGMVKLQCDELNKLTDERDNLRKALGKMSNAAMTNGWMPVPTLAELVALGVHCGDWPGYRAEPTQTEAP
jgi:hypothetical protein